VRKEYLAAVFPWAQGVPAWLKVTVIGTAMPLVYWLGIVRPYPLAFGLANPRGSWVKTGEASFSALALQIGVYLLLTLLYVAALHLLTPAIAPTPQRAPVRFIGLVWAICSVALLFAAPNGESHDIYDYIFRGQMVDHFAASPLMTTPNAYPHAPFYRYVAWQRHVDTYGPLWEYTSAATAKMVRITLAWTASFYAPKLDCPQSAAACRTLAAYITGYRLLAMLFTGFSALLIHAIVRTTQPRLAPLALATWLWNPLLLMATALGAHNDALMLLLFFLTYWLWQRRWWLAGWLAFGLATQVKLTALLLVPALGLWLACKLGWLRALGISLMGVGLTLLISWALYAPLGGWATLPRMLHERQLFVAHSLAQMLYFLLYQWSAWPYPLVRQMMLVWPTWLFLAAAALLLLRTFTRTTATLVRSPSELYRLCTLLVLLYLLVGSFWFQPWYLVWVLAPAALWVDGRFPRRGLPWACLGALCSNVIYAHLTQLPTVAAPKAHLYHLAVTVLVVMTIWLPLFIAQAVDTRQQRASTGTKGPLGRTTPS